MKNKEIEELLDKLKDKDWYDELDLTGTRWIELKQEETNLLLSHIEQLEKENKILRENAEHNDKVVDKVNWEINILKNNRDKAIEILGNYKHYSTPTEEQNRENEDIVDNTYNILKGDSDD